MSDENFRLIEYLNLFMLIPDFVYPIYYHEGKFYFPDGDAYFIGDFVELQDPMKSDIQPVTPDKKILRTIGRIRAMKRVRANRSGFRYCARYWALKNPKQ